jgi:aspartyl-tRNA(Asn)/glutamyl-tRNA(Gln) amidotransferase subunit A
VNEFNQWSYKLNPPLQTNKSGELLDKVFSLKELFNTANHSATASTRAKLPACPASPLVDRLLSEGAILAGHVHTHEIALGLFGWNPILGQGLNPHDPERISGGSSSGTAITVATRECDFSLGTDTGGSIRVPAAFCGVFGFKPTTQRISTQGVIPLSSTLDHVGIMAREISLISKVFKLLSYKKTDSQQKPATRKIGLWDVEKWVEPQTWLALLRFADNFISNNYEIEKFTFLPGPEVYSHISLTEAARFHNEALSQENPKFGEMTLKLLRQGQANSEENYQAALKERLNLQNQASKLFQKYDFLIGPTVPCPAPKLETQNLILPEAEVPLRQALLRLTSPWSVVGVPVVAVPLPLDSLFVGAQVIGPAGQDEELLDFIKDYV